MSLSVCVTVPVCMDLYEMYNSMIDSLNEILMMGERWGPHSTSRNTTTPFHFLVLVMAFGTVYWPDTLIMTTSSVQQKAG